MEDGQGHLVVESREDEPQFAFQIGMEGVEAADDQVAEEEAMERELAERRAIWRREMERRVSEGTMVCTVSTVQYSTEATRY